MWSNLALFIFYLRFAHGRRLDNPNQFLPDTNQSFSVEGFNVIYNFYAVPKSSFVFLNSLRRQNYNIKFIFGEKYGHNKKDDIWQVSNSAEILYRRKLRFYDGVTVILLEDATPLISHFFHFIEHIFSLCGLALHNKFPLQNIKRILLPDLPKESILDSRNNLHNDLLKLVFPNLEEIIGTEQWVDILKSNVVHLEVALISDRGATKQSALASMWNKMMAPVATITRDHFPILKRQILESIYSENVSRDFNIPGHQQLEVFRVDLPISSSALSKHGVVEIRPIQKIDLHVSAKHSKYYIQHLQKYGSRNSSFGTGDIDMTLSGHRINCTVVYRVGSRSLNIAALNQLLRLLQETGLMTIRIVNLDKLTLRQQVRLVAESGILIGTHGMGLLHTLWLNQPPSLLVEIFPPDSYLPDFQLFAYVSDCRHFAFDASHGFIHGSQYLFTPVCAAETHRPRGNVRVHQYDLLHIEDLVDSILRFSVAEDTELYPYLARDEGASRASDSHQDGRSGMKGENGTGPSAGGVGPIAAGSSSSNTSKEMESRSVCRGVDSG